MKNLIITISLLVMWTSLLLGLPSCGHQRGAPAAAYDTTKFVRVAVIRPEIAEQVAMALTRAGIPGNLDKRVQSGGTVPSGFYPVSVPPEFRSRAVELLRKEMAAHSDQIQF